MIQWVYEQGWSDLVYFSFHGLGFLAVVLFNLWYGPKLGFSKIKALLTTAVVYGVTYVWIYIQCWAETGFRDFGGNNIVRGFVYIPLIAWPVAKLLKITWERMCCLVAPCVCLVHGISHLGCIFGGCCRGYEWSWGIYNPVYQSITFPIQIIEALTALAIVVWLLARAKKRGYGIDPYAYPWMLVLFGFTRFIWEFGRVNKKLLWGCSSLAFHALFMGVVGVIMLIYLSNKRRKNK